MACRRPSVTRVQAERNTAVSLIGSTFERPPLLGRFSNNTTLTPNPLIDLEGNSMRIRDVKEKEIRRKFEFVEEKGQSRRCPQQQTKQAHKPII